MRSNILDTQSSSLESTGLGLRFRGESPPPSCYRPYIGETIMLISRRRFLPTYIALGRSELTSR